VAAIGRAGLLQLPRDSGQPPQAVCVSKRSGAAMARRARPPEPESQTAMGAHDATDPLLHPHRPPSASLLDFEGRNT
jgi:hypothetical protein